jgi:pSer/pThr/pTyr-binding forkhead associated (FHA) protein
MSYNPTEPNQYFVLPIFDGTGIQAALATLKIPPSITQNELKRLLGSAFFSENASLVLSNEKAHKSLVVSPLPLTLLGRSEEGNLADIHINFAPYGEKAMSVSRLHAILHRGKNVISIEDLDSTNGTYINGQQLTPHVSQILHDNDEIMLGNLHIRVAFQYG